MQFNLPDVGEGLTEGEILKWLVKPGDEIALNQPLVEVETAKAAVELPSPYAGRVVELLHGEGDVVPVGSPIISVDTEPSAAPEAAAPSAAEPATSGAGQRTAVLVGYGPKTATARRRARKPEILQEVESAEPAELGESVEPAALARVLAKPPVRKLARDLGIDLTGIAGTGANGVITRDDVARAAGATQPETQLAEPTLRIGGEQRVPIRGVRRLTAEAMVASAFTAPHVTCFVDADMTATMELLAQLKHHPDFTELRLSPLLIAAKAVLSTIKRHAIINSTWDEQRGEIVIKEYVNLGIAAATPRGLIVPNIKDAHRLSTRELAIALGELADTARQGKTLPEQMSGGTFTITNIGVFGVDAGTPILPPGEAAILALGAIRPRPWVHQDEIVPRQIATLALSFDHRIIDGEQGSKFLADVARFLEDPTTLQFVWG